MDADIPYLLLTPGPLTTTRTVREAMGTDYSTWDVDYNNVVQEVRSGLVALATDQDGYTATLMQGSGTFSVEATIGSVVPRDGKLLIISNGAYGDRITKITRTLGIDLIDLDHGEQSPPHLDRIRQTLNEDPAITDVAMVHCETTTGMVNPVTEVGLLAKEFSKRYIVDAMSSFGGMPMTMESTHADFIISSANKCIQGVPGFGFVIASRETMESLEGRARSLSLDLHDQWKMMENAGGKWRYTSPTHVLMAFRQALRELHEEGGVEPRYQRYCENQRRLVAGLRNLGFDTLLPDELHSPVITSFYYPADSAFEFTEFYRRMKERRFVIYPGKVSDAECFRVGTIGNVIPEDIDQLVAEIRNVAAEMGIRNFGST
ncbi:MAG: 2-aminoethylphosphonate--pyruvate transaminase [Planctomycetota bacterium]|nr:2-aminoethylphosphonate--pyruvate transaminase [Planctomycetota bacterium]